MGRIDTIRSHASEFIGTPVHRCAIVHPPRTYRPLTDHGHLKQPTTGPGIVLPEGERLTGMAADLPNGSSGIIAVTDDEVVYLKFKIGGRPVERLAAWRSEDLRIEFRPKQGWGTYPGLQLSFADGSEALVKGEKRWGIMTFE